MSSVRALAPLACLALGLASAAPAQAGAACGALVVEADESLRSLDAALPARVRRALEGRDGVDTCARVKLGGQTAAIRVDVWLEDGRRATRTIRDREDIIPTLEALLFVPEPATAPDADPANEQPTELASAPSPAAVDNAMAASRAEPPARQPVMFDAATPTGIGPAGTRTHTSPGAVPRLLVHSHLNFAPGALLRTFIGVDAEVGAAGPSDVDVAGGQRGLPRWVVGLALGATLGTR